jgi:hypothetical protein
MAYLENDGDFVIHAGDIAYCSGDQVCWDHHFLTLEPLLAKKAYMVCMGNHVNNYYFFF